MATSCLFEIQRVVSTICEVGYAQYLTCPQNQIEVNFDWGNDIEPNLTKRFGLEMETISYTSCCYFAEGD